MTTKKRSQRHVEVAQVEGAEVPAQILAQSIVDISAAMKKLLDGPLNKRALILLIHDAAVTVGKRDIALVLDSVAVLEKLYIKKPGQQ